MFHQKKNEVILHIEVLDASNIPRSIVRNPAQAGKTSRKYHAQRRPEK